MSTATLELEPVATTEDVFQYRALHTGAVIGLVLALFSAVFTLVASASSPEACIWVALLNAPALSLCLWSLAKIRREPDQYSGRPLASIGAAISLVFLLGGVGLGGYEYLTEVPEGYTRISFNAMKPDPLEERGGILVPPEIAELDGKKVFIKGYIRPDSITVSRGIDRFLLVRDNNQCCFGDISTVKYYDQMMVEMVGSRRVDYGEGIFSMGGVLKVEPQNATLGPMRPVFSLKADYAKYK